METGGGANNASTSTDRTNYYSWGPSELLPTLLWLDADRLQALGENMTQEKLDLQRDVVRNERREGVENTPYGSDRIIIPDALYPVGHPYHHSVIGSHEDLEAASVEDVKSFFATHYVPGNATLVVAGDFESAKVKQVIASSFGAIPAKPVPVHRTLPPATLDQELRRIAVDDVEYPKLYLVWHSPARFKTGDAEMDIIADILSDGASSRLYERLVIQDQLAQNVTAYQYSKELGSQFHIEITARAGADLEEIKRITLAILDELKQDGPREDEITRVVASMESSFLRRMEDLGRRADTFNLYRHYLGTADGFDLDQARYRDASVASVQQVAKNVFGQGRVDLRILPEGAAVDTADLDKRPEDFDSRAFEPPLTEDFTLSNGIVVHALSRPGGGLFAGELIVAGGDRLIPAKQAGLGSLSASLLTSGAAGKSATEYADAVASLGASVDASIDTNHLTVDVNGLSSRLDATLDLFADTILRADLEQDDFDRELDLALNRIQSRTDSPVALASIGSWSKLFGRDDARGRPTGGYAATVEGLSLADVQSTLPTLLNPANARFVFVGDFEIDRVKTALEKRFGKWKVKAEAAPALPEPLTAIEQGSLTMIDRPGAAQTVIFMLRPVPAVDPAGQAQRSTLNTLFGGSFTSRLNQNLREQHGYTYGARSRFTDDGTQYLLYAYSSVQTKVTGPSMTEFKLEFDRLASGDVTPDELTKAVKTSHQNLVNTAETTGALVGTFADLVMRDKPLDSISVAIGELKKVGLSGLNKAARSDLYDWDKLQIILVGDSETVLPQLKEAGFPEPGKMSVDSLM